MNTYRFTSVTSTSPKVINAAGQNFYYLDGTATGSSDNTILVRIDGQQSFEVLPGQGFRLPRIGTNWTISAKSGAVSGSLMIGLGDFKNNRVAGQVQSVDGSRLLALQNQSFMLAGRVSITASINTTALVFRGYQAADGTTPYLKKLRLYGDFNGASLIKLATTNIAGLTAQGTLIQSPASSRTLNISPQAGIGGLHGLLKAELWSAASPFNYSYSGGWVGQVANYLDIAGKVWTDIVWGDPIYIEDSYAFVIELPINFNANWSFMAFGEQQRNA